MMIKYFQRYTIKTLTVFTFYSHKYFKILHSLKSFVYDSCMTLNFLVIFFFFATPKWNNIIHEIRENCTKKIVPKTSS